MKTVLKEVNQNFTPFKILIQSMKADNNVAYLFFTTFLNIAYQYMVVQYDNMVECVKQHKNY